MDMDPSCYAARSSRDVYVGTLCLILGLLAVAVLGVSVAWTPEEIAAGAHVKALRLPLSTCAGCAWCGMSRAFSALSHLRPLDAVQLNAGVVLHYPAVLLLATIGPIVAYSRFTPRTKP